jgi:hypothetical protein
MLENVTFVKWREARVQKGSAQTQRLNYTRFRNVVTSQSLIMSVIAMKQL